MSTGLLFEDLRVGQAAGIGTTIFQADIPVFAPIHRDSGHVRRDTRARTRSGFDGRGDRTQPDRKGNGDRQAPSLV